MEREVRIYTIERHTKYLIELTRIDNIEDAGDDFITSTELDEMFSDLNHYGYNGTTYYKHNIKTEMEMWKKKLIESGKKSIVIEDKDLLDAFNRDNYGYNEFKDFVKGVRKSGNKMMLFTKKVQTKPKVTDLKIFAQSAFRLIREKYKHLDICVNKYYESRHREQAILFIKANITLKEVVDHLEGEDDSYFSYNGNSKDAIKWTKVMWANPQCFNQEVKTKK